MTITHFHTSAMRSGNKNQSQLLYCGACGLGTY